MPESKRFLLRLDPRLFEALRRWADEELRSINAQIEYLLTDQARKAGRLPHQPTKRPRPATPQSTGDEPDEAEQTLATDESNPTLATDESNPTLATDESDPTLATDESDPTLAADDADLTAPRR
jgi:hypothetical protein